MKPSTIMGSGNSKNAPKLTEEQCMALAPKVPYSSIKHLARPRMVLRTLSKLEANPTTSSWLLPAIAASIGPSSSRRLRFYQWKEWSENETQVHFIAAHPSYYIYYQLMGGDCDMKATLTLDGEKLRDAGIGPTFNVHPTSDLKWWWPPVKDESSSVSPSSEDSKSDSKNNKSREADENEISPQLRRKFAVIGGIANTNKEGLNEDEVDKAYIEAAMLSHRQIHNPDVSVLVQVLDKINNMFEDPKVRKIANWYARNAAKLIIRNLKTNEYWKESLLPLMPYFPPESNYGLRLKALTGESGFGRLSLLNHSELCYLLGVPLSSNPGITPLLKLLDVALGDITSYQDEIYQRNLETLRRFRETLPHTTSEIDLKSKVPFQRKDISPFLTLEQALAYPPYDLIPVEYEGNVSYVVRDVCHGIPYIMVGVELTARERMAEKFKIPQASTFTKQLGKMSNIKYFEMEQNETNNSEK